MSSGIYVIINSKSNNCYVGQASDISDRLTRHRYLLNKNRHTCKHLQASYNKYGKSAFIFQILDTCEKDKFLLTELEQTWMDYFRFLGLSLYNTAPSAISVLGCKHSKEANKQKSIRQKLSGIRPPSNMGIKHKEETKQKISNKLKGRVFSEETLQKMRKPKKHY